VAIRFHSFEFTSLIQQVASNTGVRNSLSAFLCPDFRFPLPRHPLPSNLLLLSRASSAVKTFFCSQQLPLPSTALSVLQLPDFKLPDFKSLFSPLPAHPQDLKDLSEFTPTQERWHRHSCLCVSACGQMTVERQPTSAAGVGFPITRSPDLARPSLSIPRSKGLKRSIASCWVICHSEPLQR